MFMKILLVLVVIGFAVLLYFALKQQGEMIADGVIMKRKSDFPHYAEEFTLRTPDPQTVTEKVKAFDYTKTRTEMKGSTSNQVYKFAGTPDWTAQLYKKSEENGMSVYRFEFTHWKTSNGQPKGDLYMNMLETYLEKMFVELDENTEVRTEKLSVKSKHKIF